MNVAGYLVPSKQFPFHQELHSPLNYAMNDLIKQFPGVFWGPIHAGPRHWMLPTNGVDLIRADIKLYLKKEIKAPPPKPVVPLPPLPEDNAEKPRRPYQTESIIRAFSGPLLCAQEMRMGKTRSAIEAITVRGCKSGLIVGPAIARRVWEEQIELWWPDHPPVGLLLPGEEAPDTPFIITSYQGLKKIPLLPRDAYIIDESIALRDSRSAQSNMVKTHRMLNPNALVMLLSGQPISCMGMDLYNQLDTLQPYAFGTYKQYALRYHICEANNYSEVAKVGEVNEAYAEELQARLSHVVHRVVKSDYPGLFPALSVDILELDRPNKAANRKISKWLTGGKVSFKGLEDWLAASADQRVKAAAEWADQAEAGVIFTWLRKTAEDIAEAIGDRAILITGAETAEKRFKRLKEWKPGKVIVATAASCKSAIDLSFCHQVLFAELWWDPEVVGQAMMRLHHMDGKPLSVWLMKIKGTIDEAICNVLAERLEIEAQTIGSSAATGALKKALSKADESPAVWASRISKYAMAMEDEE